jgi:hypothetical protein
MTKRFFNKEEEESVTPIRHSLGEESLSVETRARLVQMSVYGWEGNENKRSRSILCKYVFEKRKKYGHRVFFSLSLSLSSLISNTHSSVDDFQVTQFLIDFDIRKHL